MCRYIMREHTNIQNIHKASSYEMRYRLSIDVDLGINLLDVKMVPAMTQAVYKQ